MRAFLLLFILAVAPLRPAIADFIPCAACDQGNVLIDRYALGAMRPLGPQLATLSLAEPLTAAQYATIIELRTTTPALGRLGALDDGELELVAAALCHQTDSTCATRTAHALRCLADRCEVALPATRRADVTEPKPECRRYHRRRRSPPLGVGVDWGTGWDRSRYPNDGRTWSLGLEGRMALGPKRGIVVRADHAAGRDQATDVDKNGADDIPTGSITRFMALAGPSFVLDSTGYERSTRFLRLDLLVGYLATLSQPGEDGVVAGFDLAYQVSAVRTGVRFIQGFGETGSTSMVLAHLGVAVGSVPPHDDDGDCSPRERSSRLALGFDLPFGGFGFSKLGYTTLGFGTELLWYVSRRVDVVTHADLLVFPGDKRERVIHQAVLGGARIDLADPKRSRSVRTGFYTTVMAGYTLGAGFTPTTTGSGPVIDLSLGWGVQDRDGAVSVRLHGRFGIASENEDYAAVFLSGSFELRFDPHYWRNRVRMRRW